MNGKMTKKARADVRFACTEGFAPSRDSSIVHEIATTRVTRERKAGMSFVMNGYIGMLIVKFAKSIIERTDTRIPKPSGLSKEDFIREGSVPKSAPLTSP